jgi:predicted PurR-regulated permease PerM
MASSSGTPVAPSTGSTTAEPGSVGTRAPAPSPDRMERMQSASRRVAIASAQLLLIVAGIVVIGYVLGKLWVILLPVVLGLLFSTILWPAVRFLRRHGWPPAAAAAVVLLVFLGLIGGLIALIAPQVVGQAEELANQFSGGLQEVQRWLSGPPFNLGEDQIGNAIDSLINRVQNNATSIAAYAATTAASIGNALVNLVLALVLAFFYLKDGPRFTPWVAAQTGPRAAPHVAALAGKFWQTLSEFIRQQAFVGFIDAFFIGLGLLVLGVPLVLPLAVLTFFGAFLSVPVAALIAVAYRYGRDQLDGLAPEIAPDGTRHQLTGDSSGAQLVKETVPEEERVDTPPDPPADPDAPLPDQQVD